MRPKCEHWPSVRDGKCLRCGWKPETRAELAADIELSAHRAKEIGAYSLARELEQYARRVREVLP